MDKDKLREEAISRTREKLREPVEKDVFLVKAVEQLDRLNRQFEKSMENFRDIYSQHFPELIDELDDERLVEMLERYGIEREGLEPFQGLADDSTGSDITSDEKEVMQQMLEQIINTKETAEYLEQYIREEASEEFRNLSGLLGPLLATRLVALAGGLDELAKKPASTVQMLGAEKALFRHLHGEGSSPKHGILFQHRFVNSLPESKRGKMARFLANKSVMAARIDNYGDEDKSEGLREEIEENFHDLKD